MEEIHLVGVLDTHVDVVHVTAVAVSPSSLFQFRLRCSDDGRRYMYIHAARDEVRDGHRPGKHKDWSAIVHMNGTLNERTWRVRVGRVLLTSQTVPARRRSNYAPNKS